MDNNILLELRKNKGLLANMILDSQNGQVPVNNNALPILPSTNQPIASSNMTKPIEATPWSSMSSGTSASESRQGYEIVNAAERADALRRQEEANQKALDYNNSLPAAMAELNSTIKPREKDYTLFGDRIADNYVPILPLPVMPEKVEIPNVQTASVGESWSRSKNDRVARDRSGDPKPKLILNNMKLSVDANTGTLGVNTVGVTDYSQDKGLDVLSKKGNLENVKVLKNYWSQRSPEVFNTNNTWTVEKKASDKDKTSGKVQMQGDLYDAVTRNAGNTIMKLAPDMLDLSKVSKDSQGNYVFANRSLPLRADKAYMIQQPDGKKIAFNQQVWSKVKDSPGYSVIPSQRYSEILDKATSNFVEANGEPNVGRYDTTGALYTTLARNTRDALKSTEWKSFEQQHLNNQRIDDTNALKWFTFYAHTL